ncbi:hypothetical protein IFM89_036252 [Coptis chinensis]|uniref:SUEL-type lectin domain-containing protein n=1 Tax=Coptis chinensis TaxID=261450 RepID=A0A835HJ07_9MAGN|nr:hypothetical protein IFM89_036252 [Coptis chinensis]
MNDYHVLMVLSVEVMLCMSFLMDNYQLEAGINKISLLSIVVGLRIVVHILRHGMLGFLAPSCEMVLMRGDETCHGKNGLTRSVLLLVPLNFHCYHQIEADSLDFYPQIGLEGEVLSLHSLSGSSSVEWVQGSFVAQKQPLTWYKTTFNLTYGNDPLALDMGSMGKGQVWINEQSIGRYWPAYKASGTCGSCSYTGTYDEKKCLSNCGDASQRWYHVPRSWLNPSGNLLVIFEEWGGDPNGISLVSRTVDSVCADIFELQPTLLSYQRQVSGTINQPLRPKAHLRCSSWQKISSIKFASFGTPQGICGSFKEGSCHAHKSYDAFEKVENSHENALLITFFFFSLFE